MTSSRRRASADPTPGQLLAAGLKVVDQPDTVWGSSWARSSAFFIRQALEEAVAQHWTGPLAPLADTSYACQLVCLREYLGDRALANEVRSTWHALSSACHAHPYQLAPTAGELRSWAAVVERLLKATTADLGGLPPSDKDTR